MPGSLQDAFLAECKRQGSPVTVYLVNGFQLRGIVKGYDPFTVLLEYERKTHLVYKHAISTISPGNNVALGQGNGSGAAEAKTVGPAEES
jgi:host factor-I protein